MSSQAPRVSTAGSWFGLGISAWAALIACSSALTMSIPFLVTQFADWVERQALRESRGTELPPEAGEFFNLILEGAAIFRPYALTMGASGIAVGGLLFLAGFGFSRGSDLARKAARGLLVLAMINTVIDSAWSLTLLVTKLGPWMERFTEVMNELGRKGRNAQPIFPVGFDAGGIANVISGAFTTILSLAIAGTLLWLAGRPFARNWCQARARTSPIATPERRG